MVESLKEMNGVGTISTEAIDEKERIVHARSLLKKFQTKHRDSLNGSSCNSSSAFNHELQHESREGRSSKSEQDELSLQRSRASSQASSITINPNEMLLTAAPHQHPQQQTALIDRCHSVPKNFSVESTELCSLQSALSRKQLELNDAYAKLKALHKHYAELHSAYNQLSNEHNAQKASFADQLHQLRTALAVALDEKTALQVELRELRGKGEQSPSPALSVGQQLDQHQHNEYNPVIYELESRLKRVENERDHLKDTVANQSAQIEHQRRECSNLEAKIVLIQQDRLDTQARIKSLYTEKAQLEHALEQQRNELAMREIYLKQLARHSGVEQPELSSRQPDAGDIKALGQDIRQQLESELARHKTELDGLQKQLQVAREQHHMAIAESSAHIQRLERECGHLRSVKAELESANNFMEEQHRLLRAQMEELAANAKESLADQTSHMDSAELARLKDSVAVLNSDKEAAMAKLTELGHLLEEKDQSIDELRHCLDEAHMRIGHLEQSQSIQATMDTDVVLLSTQLQNEKATVSRAVAQNMELKRQFGELQDKLVRVINESAGKEDQRLSALAAVERLKQELNSAREEIKRRMEEQTLTGQHESSTIVSASSVEQSQQTDFSEQFTTDESVHSLPDNTEGTTGKSNSCIGVQTDDLKEEETDEKCEERSTYSNSALGIASESQHQQLVAQNDDVLAERMEALSRENQQYRANNERLEYWLTALESENESIGEYIALYRFQRGQIQRRMAEKDSALQQLQQQNTKLMAQLVELHNSVLAFLGNNKTSTSGTEEEKGSRSSASPQLQQIAETSTYEAANLPTTSADEQTRNSALDDGSSSSIDRLLRAMERSRSLGSEATCAAAQQAQIHCAGCVECRGEMCTL